MEKLTTSDPNALRFLMNEDLYDLGDAAHSEVAVDEAPKSTALPATQPENVLPATIKLPEFNYSGENNRYFLLIFHDEAKANLNSGHKEMLEKIMAAKKMELRDLAILNLALYPTATFRELKEFFSCNKLTLFGVSPESIGLQGITANQVVKQDGVKVLATFGLDEMSSSTDKKREFWQIMKDF